LRIRHPSYLGTLLFALGIPLFLSTYVGLLAYLLVMLPAYLYRIHVEEEALHQKLGDRYMAFSQKTRRLVPRIY
jgi:protein-S-isoprenylcysteine O-methyltransferase Ste14